MYSFDIKTVVDQFFSTALIGEFNQKIVGAQFLEDGNCFRREFFINGLFDISKSKARRHLESYTANLPSCHGGHEVGDPKKKLKMCFHGADQTKIISTNKT